MGNNQSSENEEQGVDLELLNGFHVLKVKPNSPAEKAGLQPYFDFIMSINDQTSINTLQDFAIYISRFANKSVKLIVFSLKTRDTRELTLYPNNNWSSNPKDGLLGCSVRYSSVEKGLASVWHILDVQPRSPADRAGLQAHSDYVVGCEYRNLESENDFYDLIEEHEGKLLSLLVYNNVWDNCREVIILPKRDWGGEGLLGCGVASGLLHRVPIELPEKGENSSDVKDASNETNNPVPIATNADNENSNVNQNLNNNLEPSDLTPVTVYAPVEHNSTNEILPNQITTPNVNEELIDNFDQINLEDNDKVKLSEMNSRVDLPQNIIKDSNQQISTGEIKTDIEINHGETQLGSNDNSTIEDTQVNKEDNKKDNTTNQVQAVELEAQSNNTDDKQQNIDLNNEPSETVALNTVNNEEKLKEDE